MYFGRAQASSSHYTGYFDASFGSSLTTGIWSVTWIATGNQRATFPGGTISLANTQYSLTSTVNIGAGLLDGSGGTMSIDWVRARKYAATTPSVSSVGTEQVLAPPSITQQPISRTVCSGSTVTFSITGTGSTFQWRKDGIAIPGATSASYTIPAAAVTDTGNYDVMISANCSPTITSSAAHLTVNTPPHITQDPVGAIGCPGKAITFSVAATGTGLTYQWRKNGINIPGQTQTSYTIASTAPADAGTYDAVVTGVCGAPVTSAVATLGVNVPPTISQQPQDTVVCRNQSFTLSVAATGTGISYR